MSRTCNRPDRDQPKILCGYPLPCPWHTAVIHADKQPPTLEVPVAVPPRALPRLVELAASSVEWAKTPTLYPSPKKKRRKR